MLAVKSVRDANAQLKHPGNIWMRAITSTRSKLDDDRVAKGTIAALS